MNKDLYIQLLEEHVADLSAAMNIDTLLAERKNERIKKLIAVLTEAKDRNKIKDELISKIADTVLDCQDDLNDLQAGWAESNVSARNALSTVVGQRTSANNENVRLQGKISDLEKNLATAHRRIMDLSEALGATPL